MSALLRAVVSKYPESRIVYPSARFASFPSRNARAPSSAYCIFYGFNSFVTSCVTAYLRCLRATLVNAFLVSGADLFVGAKWSFKAATFGWFPTVIY